MPAGRSHLQLGQPFPERRLAAAVRQAVQITDDSVTVLKTGVPAPLGSHDVDNTRFTLMHAAPFERGDLLVVCDDEISVLLQITRTANGKRTLATGPAAGVRPGNCDSPFAVDSCGPEGYRFNAGALVAPYRPVSFLSRHGSPRSRPAPQTTRHREHREWNRNSEVALRRSCRKRGCTKGIGRCGNFRGPRESDADSARGQSRLSRDRVRCRHRHQRHLHVTGHAAVPVRRARRIARRRNIREAFVCKS